MNEFICHYRDGTGVWVEAVDLVLQTRSRAEILHVAIDRIGEVDFLVLGMDRYIVQRVELTTEVVVQND